MTDIITPASAGDPQPAQPTADEYAIVEIFGHRRHAGRIQEVERFGTKMLRIDVPTEGDFANGYVTHFYGGASIFSLVMSDRASVEAENAPYRPPGRLTYLEPVMDPAPVVPAPGDDDMF